MDVDHSANCHCWVCMEGFAKWVARAEQDERLTGLAVRARLMGEG